MRTTYPDAHNPSGCAQPIHEPSARPASTPSTASTTSPSHVTRAPDPPSISHVIPVGQFSTHPTNVTIPTMRFQDLKGLHENYVRHCGGTTPTRRHSIRPPPKHPRPQTPAPAAFAATSRAIATTRRHKRSMVSPQTTAPLARRQKAGRNPSVPARPQCSSMGYQ